jgi:hypothetical protein
MSPRKCPIDDHATFPNLLLDICRLFNHLGVVDSPGDPQRVVTVVDGLAAHTSLRTDLALPRELLDRAVDNVDSVLVSDVRCVRGAEVAVRANSTRAIGSVGALTAGAASTSNRPSAAAGDVAGDLLAVGNQRRAAGALVDEARVRAVVYAFLSGTSENNAFRDI